MRHAILLSTLLLAACSGGDDNAAAPSAEGSSSASADSAAADGAKACDVLDKASVDAAMGRDMGQPTSNTDGMCQYVWSGEKIADQALATLTIEAVPLSRLEPGLAAQKARMTPVSGIGDRAIWADGYGLYVEHGGRSGIYVAGQGYGDDEKAQNMAKTEALAKATIAKL